jgi:hypothetical protein
MAARSLNVEVVLHYVPFYYVLVSPIGRAVESVGLRPLAC